MRPTANQTQTETPTFPVEIEVQPDNPVQTLATLLNRMPGGDSIAKSMLRLLAAEMEMAAAKLDFATT